MPKPRIGLRIKHCENVATYKQDRGGYKLKEAVADGWFIQVMYGSRWHSLMDLRFMREKDALRAAQALTAAGLDSHGALAKADPMTVKAIACTYLQW
jgi:hypothetical protein